MDRKPGQIGHTREQMERAGYESFVELWVQQEGVPPASECPARWMKEGEKRLAFIRGWNRAKAEATTQHPEGGDGR